MSSNNDQKQPLHPKIAPQVTEADFLHEKQKVIGKLNRELKKMQNRLTKSKNDLETFLKWPNIRHEAMLLQSNLFQMKRGMQDVLVPDWEKEGELVKILLNPKENLKDEIKKRFVKSRKMKIGVEYAQKYIKIIEKKSEEISQKIAQVMLIESFDELKSFYQIVKFQKDKKEKQIKAPRVPFREYHSVSGLAIWVGKTAKDNDKLTFCFAHGSDWWFHAKDCPGSHVVLRVKKNQEPDQESIQDAIQLALIYSKAKEKGEAEVCVTQCKFVSRFGKLSPGKVQLSKHKTVNARLDQERFRRLKGVTHLL